MHVVSVQVGGPREVSWQGKTITTSIFKEPVAGRVAVRQLNLAGDHQSDLTVHGGAEKAIYVYPAEYYRYWREQLPDIAFTWGAFGENLTIEGLLDTTVATGDQLRIGSALCKVTQPRIPCYKLNVKFGRTDMIERFSEGGRSGFYLAVLEAGEVAAGDAITVLKRAEPQITINDVARLFSIDHTGIDSAALQHALLAKELPTRLRQNLQRKLDRLEHRA